MLFVGGALAVFIDLFSYNGEAFAEGTYTSSHGGRIYEVENLLH